MTVHDLYTALSQQDRAATVTIKNGKLHVGNKKLKISETDDDGDADGEPTS